VKFPDGQPLPWDGAELRPPRGGLRAESVAPRRRGRDPDVEMADARPNQRRAVGHMAAAEDSPAVVPGRQEAGSAAAAREVPSSEAVEEDKEITPMVIEDVASTTPSATPAGTSQGHALQTKRRNTHRSRSPGSRATRSPPRQSLRSSPSRKAKRVARAAIAAAADPPSPAAPVPMPDLTEERDHIEEDIEPPVVPAPLDEAPSTATTETNPLADASRRAG